MITPLLALAVALLAPQPIERPADPISPIQWVHRGPADAVDLDPGDAAVVLLEKGAHGGLTVLGSNGIVTPNCPVVVAAAQVIADGPVVVSLDVGVRLGQWMTVIDGGPVLPMTAVPVRPGQSLRLRVTNAGRARVRIEPIGTRLSVYAASCAPVPREGLIGL